MKNFFATKGKTGFPDVNQSRVFKYQEIIRGMKNELFAQAFVSIALQ